MNSIKTVKGLLSQDFTIKAFDEKDSDYWSESFSLDHRKDNYKKTSVVVNYLKDNGYSATEDSKL